MMTVLSLFDFERQRAAVLIHLHSGGLFLHPAGFLARIYVSRTHTGAWLVRCRCASLRGRGPWACARLRFRTRELAMRAVRRLLVPLMVVPGEDRPIDAVPLFAERDGYRIETTGGVVLFPSMRKCQICWRLNAKECAYKCGAVLCADCGALHDPPDCPPQMAEYLADQERASAEYAEAQGQIMHGIRDAAAEPVTGEGDPC